MGYDDSITEEFVIESQDHLESIEDDFLQLAANKDNPDPGLVDKIFRAAHSIKGGAGFLQLTNISSLAHAMETVLSALREGSLAITSEIIDTLLKGVDNLNEMLENVHESNDMDIKDIYDETSAILNTLTGDKGMGEDVPLKDDEGGETGFEITPVAIENLPGTHEFIYILKYDLAELQEQGKSPIRLIKDLQGAGIIVDARIDAGSEDLREGVPEGPLLYEVLYASLLEPTILPAAVNLPESRIQVLDREKLLSQVRSEEATAKAEKPEPAAEPAPPPVQEEEILPPMEDDFSSDMMQLLVTPEMVEQFISESDEMLEQAEQNLIEIFDSGAPAPEDMNEAFRLIHSFKGNAGLLNYKVLEVVSHRMETALDFFRSGVVPKRTADRDIMFAALDFLKSGVAEISNEGQLGQHDVAKLLKELDSLLPEGNDTSDMSETFVDQRRVPVEGGAGKPPAKGEPKAAPSKKPAKVERRDIRVDLDRLDALINLVGELVIAESMVTRNDDLQGLSLENFDRATHNLRRIIADLQDVAMAVRMVPLSRTFRKMIRLVHDLSKKAGKKVDLSLVGEETEVDKTVIEQIADPLVHIVRNSVDHGMEPPAERTAVGKPEMGTVTIEAKHEGGEVLIIVHDDGRGLNRDKILAKAIQNGLIQGDGSDLHDDEVNNMIFEPGFSTAEKITDVSGRGVGMDVVRRNLEKIKGRVDVHSSPGKGSSIVLRIPLTLAIIEGMLIRVGLGQYTIPLLSIRESFRPTPEQVTITMDGQEVVRVREEMLPVVRLHEVYNLKSDYTDLNEGILVIVESGRKAVCLFADEIMGQHQTVIKGMPTYLGDARGISGCTILGNGEVSLILDVGGLIDMTEQKSNWEDTNG